MRLFSSSFGKRRSCHFKICMCVAFVAIILLPFGVSLELGCDRWSLSLIIWVLVPADGVGPLAGLLWVLWVIEPSLFSPFLAVGDVHVVQIFELLKCSFTIGCCFVVLQLLRQYVLALVTARIPQQVLPLPIRRVEIVAILLKLMLTRLVACKYCLLTLQLLESFKSRIHLWTPFLHRLLLNLN